MDTITHGLTGMVLAKAGLDRGLGRWGTVTGLVVGVFPDSDFLLGIFGREFYLRYHRNFTHSIFLAIPIAILFSVFFKKVSGRGEVSTFFWICLPVLVVHILMDLITSYGTMVLSPLSDDRFAWDLIFIVDPIFFGILIISLILSIFWKSSTSRICQISLFFLAIYVLFCAFQHQRAKELASSYAKEQGIRVNKMASLPQPLSPFRWVNLIEDHDFVYQGFVDFAKGNTARMKEGATLLGRLRSQYRPPEKVVFRAWKKTVDLPWVDRAMDEKGVRFFFWFARFPVLKGLNSQKGSHRVEFFDLRFYVIEDRVPFVYAVEFDDQGRIASKGFID